MTRLTGHGSGHLFRANVVGGGQRQSLFSTFDWRFILDVEADDLHLLVLSERVDTVRGLVLTLLSVAPPAIAVIAAFRYLNGYLSNTISGLAVPIWSLSSLVLGLVLFAFGVIGLISLLDFLTIRLQARFATDFATLNLKEIRAGRFHHTLRVSVKRGISVPDLKPATKAGDFLINIVWTRQSLRSTLGPHLLTSDSVS